MDRRQFADRDIAAAALSRDEEDRDRPMVGWMIGGKQLSV